MKKVAKRLETLGGNALRCFTSRAMRDTARAGFTRRCSGSFFVHRIVLAPRKESREESFGCIYLVGFMGQFIA